MSNEIEMPKIEMWPIKKVKPYKRNHKSHSDEQILLLVKSMKRWGVTKPIMVNPKGTIIAGEGRYHAFKKIGLETIPVTVKDLPESEEKALRIADNEIANIGTTFDQKIRMEEMAEFKLDDEMMALTNLKLTDYVYNIKAPNFEQSRESQSSSFAEFEAAEKELKEATIASVEKPETEEKTESQERQHTDDTPKEVKPQTFHFYVEIKGAYTKKELQEKIKDALSQFHPNVR